MISTILIILISVAVLENVSAQGSMTTIPTTQVPLTLLNCPDDRVQGAVYGGDTASVNWDEPTSNVPDLPIDRSHGRPPQSFKIGERTITYSVTDGVQTDTCEFKVTVFDNQPPILSNCPQRAIIKEISAQGSENSAVVEFNVGAQDNAGPSKFTIQTTPYPSGSMFPYGSTSVIVNATDESGNSAPCYFSVIVRAPLDYCSSDMSDKCAPTVIIRDVTETQITAIWPTELDLSVTGQYLVSYWPEGEEENRKNYTKSFAFDVLRYPYIYEEIIRGLTSGTLYVLDIQKRYSNGTIATVGRAMQRTQPASVGTIEIREITATTAKVSWNPNNSYVDQFHVYYTDRFVDYDVGYFPKSVNEVVLTNLSPSQPNGANAIRVTVETVIGSGNQKVTTSADVTFTAGQIPSEDAIEIKNFTETSIGFTWSARPFSNAQPYLLYLFDDDNKQTDFALGFPYTQLPLPEYEFTNLQPLTSYTITIVYNGHNIVPAFKSSLEHKTSPRRIENLRATDVSNNSFTITWDRARNSYPDEYHITISPHDDSNIPRPVVVTQNEYEFKALRDNTEYYVTVLSVEDGMESIPVSVMITTGVPVPEVEGESQDLFLPIIIGAALGVFILFLIIIIFFLLCMIPCNTIPPPQTTPAKDKYGQSTLVYAYSTHQQPEEEPKVSEVSANKSVKMPPTILHPHPPPNRKPPARESSAGLVEMEAPTEGHGDNNEIPNQEIYVNVFGLPLKQNRFLSRRSKIDRPIEDGIPGNFNRRKISAVVEPQIYDDVPAERHEYDDDFDEDP
ncbi:uncharacterized protein [Amphiura filiformis]|uniref:uncharacterized protein n=1 Tax=Amphiura filiformis TaxID=82378 RepID=UPI003B2212FE